MSIFRELGIPEGKDRVNEEVVYTVARTYTVLEQTISQFLSKYNLTPAKFNILLMVKSRGGERGLAQNEISSLLLVTTSNITRMVDKLERDDYVQRFSQEGDRRVNLVKITKKGIDLLDKVWPHYKSMVDALIGTHFSNSEKRTISGLLQKLRVKIVKH